MARKSKALVLPTGERLGMINGVLRKLASMNVFIGDRTVVRLTQDIPFNNLDGKLVHTAKAGECYVAMPRRYDWEVIVPNPDVYYRMTWHPVVQMDACEVVPQTAEEQQNTMLTYLDVENEHGPRITQQVNEVFRERAFDIYPAGHEKSKK